TRSKRDWSSDVCSSDLPTSDNPVINLNYYRKDKYDFNGGWGVDNTCIMMPLTPKHLLYTQVGYNGSIKHLDKSIEWTNFFVKLRSEERRVGKECRYRWL